MIKASIWQSADGVYLGYEIFGHAGFAEEGTDIICSAVSALAINTVNSISTFTNLKPSTRESHGHLQVEIAVSEADPDQLDKTQLLLGSLKLGLESIQTSYGSKYLQVRTIQK
ncbi:MAG: ribosomal-processing cysteine protease Prp [Lachnospiraceae bacterium]|nr:ribosomal-processing cysteine protease Prp [Lachnospiraceae bacterium]